ncbi:MAG TPA: hypothetical protein VK053_15140, partial [Jiangellaceae bacterium]|nr:hypothetical protein [Jiangellaceae bacterium]
MPIPIASILRRVLLAVLAAAALVALGAPPPALGASPSPTPTANTDSAEATPGTGSTRQEGSGEPRAVLIGVTGLSWADIDRENTPTLFEMAGTSSVASMTVRTVRSETCPVDGWLTLGAGSRAT